MTREKIAIVSYHNSFNYGTMLQAYALSAALSKLGCTSDYISYYYKMSFVRKVLSNIKQRLIRNSTFFAKKIAGEFHFFDTPAFEKIIEKYHLWYNKNIPHTEYVYNQHNINELNKIYRTFIVGSDQTWSPYMNNTPYSMFFNLLEFVADDNSRNAYAPSFGTASLSEEYIQTIVKQLKKFDNISCREDYGSELLSKELGRDVEYVLDPTLLLLPEDWNEVSEPVTEVPEKYILCYILGEKQCISEFAEKLGREEQLPVYYILTRPYYFQKKNVLDNIGPGEFISLIRGATFVCTDSYHGSLFSINFHVPFYSFTKRIKNDCTNDNDRIINILSSLGMYSRFRNDDNYLFETNCSFDNMEKLLSERREKSYAYLQKIVDVNNFNFN